MVLIEPKKTKYIFENFIHIFKIWLHNERRAGAAGFQTAEPTRNCLYRGHLTKIMIRNKKNERNVVEKLYK